MNYKKKEKKLSEAILNLSEWHKTYENIFSQDVLIDYAEVINILKIPNKLTLLTFNLRLLKKILEYRKDYNNKYILYNNLEQKIKEHNAQIIIKKIDEFKQICGRVENRELDNQQIESIIRRNKNQLVIAGAGSGKTTTIVGKVKYLIKTNFCNPKEILLLSFTNAAAEEIKRRVEKEIGEKIDTFTFHKLGKEIISYCTNKCPTVSENLSCFIQQTLNKLINEDEYLKLLIHFFTIGKYEIKDEFEFSNYEEYKMFLLSNPPTTLNGETVKSYGELEIANFLYCNNIYYKYEEPYKVDKSSSEYKQYCPDFYLPDYDIYIEYFSIDRDGDVAPYFEGKNGKSAKETYNDSLSWKIMEHKNNNTILIDTYYYEKKENNLIKNLKNKLVSYNVQMKKKTEQQIWNEIIDDKKHIIVELSKMFETIINLIKSNNYSINRVKELIEHSYNKFNNLMIIKLIEPVYNEYQNYLKNNNKIDFNDMINLAIDFVMEGKYIHNYKYVIVDEYQDISKSRYKLLKVMREKKDYDLFCVGDDWQSIYRFSGSDIGLIINFEEFWGKTHISKIEKTYRFSNKLAQISGNFIMKNSNQIQKNVFGMVNEKFPLAILNGYNERICINFLIDRLLKLEQNSTIYFIGRYNFDIDIFKNRFEFTIKYNNVEKTTDIFLKARLDLKIKFLTAHKSKGLQADYVFVINNKLKGMGFPSRIADLPIINLLLEKIDEFPYSEERRLFYVAITRSIKKTFLLTIDDNKSVFIKELEEKYNNEFKNEYFECPKCNGKLVKKKGKNGYFLGCTNYPNCKYTKSLRINN